MELGATDIGEPGPGDGESEEPEGSDWEYKLPRLSYSCCYAAISDLEKVFTVTHLGIVVVCLPVPIVYVSVHPEDVIITTIIIIIIIT